jgi:alkylated DNA repair dioxygenase AlkB
MDPQHPGSEEGRMTQSQSNSQSQTQTDSRDSGGIVDRIEQAFVQQLERYDLTAISEQFEEQAGLIVLEDFLPKSVLEDLLRELEEVRGEIHRNFVPGQKKGGSVSRHILDRVTAVYPKVYASKVLREFLNELTGEELLSCPPSDPHTYALYCYQEPGDHIGWHYDTSFYKGRRFTMLFGLVENDSCMLECELYRDDPNRETEPFEVVLRPGTMVIFDGDHLWHRVTPMAADDGERIVLTTEFVTDTRMNPIRRLISNVKDAAAYFGFREVFFGPHKGHSSS